MSVSTDALFFYGICWDEEGHVWPWEREGDDDLLEKVLDDDEDSDEGRIDAEDDENRVSDGLDDETRSEKYGLQIGTHCLASCPMGYVAIPSTFARAWRGGPVKIDEEGDGDRTSLPADPANPVREWNKLLKKFCKDYGYDFDDLMDNGKIGWFLCSDSDMDS
jgi:hypothetical protein